MSSPPGDGGVCRVRFGRGGSRCRLLRLHRGGLSCGDRGWRGRGGGARRLFRSKLVAPQRHWCSVAGELVDSVAVDAPDSVVPGCAPPLLLIVTPGATWVSRRRRARRRRVGRRRTATADVDPPPVEAAGNRSSPWARWRRRCRRGRRSGRRRARRRARRDRRRGRFRGRTGRVGCGHPVAGRHGGDQPRRHRHAAVSAELRGTLACGSRR